MKVIIVSPFFTPYAGVGVNRMSSLAKQLQDRYEVGIITYNPELYDRITEDPLPNNVELFEVYAPNKNFLSSVFYFYKEIRKQIRCYNPDVILFSGGPFFTLFNVIAIPKTDEIRILYDFRDYWISQRETISGQIKDFLKSIIIKVSARKISHIITVTPKMSADFIRKYNIPKGKISVVMNGHENVYGIIEKEKERPLKEKEYLDFGIFGRAAYYSEEKLIALFNALSEIDFKFRIFQYGNENISTYSSVFSHIPGNTSYYYGGYLSYEKMLRKTNEMDLCLIINDYEVGLGTKVFDYISLNKPILLVDSSNSELASFVNQFKGGLVACHKDEIKIALYNMINENITSLFDDMSNIWIYSRYHQNKKMEDIILSK